MLRARDDPQYKQHQELHYKSVSSWNTSLLVFTFSSPLLPWLSIVDSAYFPILTFRKAVKFKKNNEFSPLPSDRKQSTGGLNRKQDRNLSDTKDIKIGSK